MSASKLWREAIRQAEADLAVHDQFVTPTLPRQCPLAIQDIVDPGFDFERPVATVREQIEGRRAQR
jgi:hypothetical protein